MGFFDPPIYDVFNIDMWKFKMNAYLKALGLHIYLTTTKKSYVDNGKHLKANIQALKALRHTLSKEQCFMISHYDSAFAMWNTLTNYVEKEPMVD